MFAVYRNNISLKLPNNAVLNTSLYAQIVNENTVRGAFSIPIEVPIEGNELFFDGLHQLKQINSARLIEAGLLDVKVYLQGVWWLGGKINILRIKEDSLSINLVVGLPGISSLDDKLQDLDWDTISLPSDSDPTVDRAYKTSFLKARIDSGYDPSDSSKSFTLPLIVNPKYYGQDSDKNKDYLGIINNFNDVTEPYGLLRNVYMNLNSISPMVYYIEILRKGFEKGGYKFDYSNLSTDFIKKPCINNFDLCRMVPAHGAKTEMTAPEGMLDNDGIVHGPINFNNVIYDQSLLLFGSSYTIARPGTFKIEYNLPYHFTDYLDSATYVVRIILGDSTSSIRDTEEFFTYDATLGGNAQKRIYITFSTADVGRTIFLNYYFLVSGASLAGTGVTNLVLEAGGWIRITCVSNPTVNDFGTSIPLSKCVPQDILFRDFINQYSRTFNIEFIIDDQQKIVTAKLNEPDLNSTPENRDSYWRSNSEKPTVEIREQKFKYLNYDFGSDDSGVIVFKEFHSSDYLGEEDDYASLLLSYPPDDEYDKKIVLVWNENAYYQCIWNEDAIAFIWSLYCDSYADISVGNGVSTLKLPISPLMMRHHEFDDFTMVAPYMEMEANSINFGLENKLIALRMLFFIGRATIPLNSGGTTTMPYSTINRFPYLKAGDISTSTVSFSMELNRDESGDEYGMLSFWKKTIALLNLERKVIKKLNLRLDEILSWSFRKRLSMDGAVYSVEQLTISTSKVAEDIDCEVELGIEEVEEP
jgi:hypothetical protein